MDEKQRHKEAQKLEKGQIACDCLKWDVKQCDSALETIFLTVVHTIFSRMHSRSIWIIAYEDFWILFPNSLHLFACVSVSDSVSLSMHAHPHAYMQVTDTHSAIAFSSTCNTNETICSWAIICFWKHLPTSQPSEIYLRYARLVHHLKNQLI